MGPHAFLVVRMMTNVYDLHRLPDGKTRGDLIAPVWRAIDALDRRYHATVVLGPKEAGYLELGGTSRARDAIPQPPIFGWFRLGADRLDFLNEPHAPGASPSLDGSQ